MSPRLFRIFVLGGFTDVGGVGLQSKKLLQGLVTHLRHDGWDAFLSGDPRSLEIAGGRLNPRTMTEVLEPISDLSVFVGWAQGRADGWVSELTALQIKRPERAPARLVAIEEGYPLTSILDPECGGYLSEPPVTIRWWWGEEDLFRVVRTRARQMRRRRSSP